jgi:hypothetical protein
MMHTIALLLHLFTMSTGEETPHLHAEIHLHHRRVVASRAK